MIVTYNGYHIDISNTSSSSSFLNSFLSCKCNTVGIDEAPFGNFQEFVNQSPDLHQVVDAIKIDQLAFLRNINPTGLLTNLVRDDIDEMETEITNGNTLLICQPCNFQDDREVQKIIQLGQRMQQRNKHLIIGTLENVPISYANSVFIGYIGTINVRDENCAQRLQDACKLQTSLRGAPILVSFFDFFAFHPDSVAWAFDQKIKFLMHFVDTFRKARSGKGNLILSGLEMLLPNLYTSDVIATMEALFTEPDLYVVLNVPPSCKLVQMGLETFTSFVLDLAKKAEKKVILGNSIRFKTCMIKYGGNGYASIERYLLPKLRQTNTDRLLYRNALEALSWWVAPAPEARPPTPTWNCDACGKTMSAKREPFTRLLFKYCSMTCLRNHRTDDPPAQDQNSNGGKRPGGGSSVGSWGITVGSH